VTKKVTNGTHHTAHNHGYKHLLLLQNALLRELSSELPELMALSWKSGPGRAPLGSILGGDDGLGAVPPTATTSLAVSGFVVSSGSSKSLLGPLLTGTSGSSQIVVRKDSRVGA
jgi:hypothetical protein